MKPTAIALLLALPLLLNGMTLQDLLARLDATAASFHGVKTKVAKTTYTAVIEDSSTEIGTMWMVRRGKKIKDIRMHLEITEPDVKSVAFQGKKAEIYYPKIKTVHEYDLGKQQSLVDQFLLLGFGTSGKKLAKDYKLKLIGEEEIEKVPTVHLELTPKSKKTRERLVRVDLWISKDKLYPVRQKFYWPSDDTTTITYTEVELNPKLTDADLVLKLPPGVKREYPQR